MGCLIALFARLALLVVWVSTPLVDRAFHGGWLWVVLALLLDLGAHSSGAYTNRHRIPGYKRK